MLLQEEIAPFTLFMPYYPMCIKDHVDNKINQTSNGKPNAALEGMLLYSAIFLLTYLLYFLCLFL